MKTRQQAAEEFFPFQNPDQEIQFISINDIAMECHKSFLAGCEYADREKWVSVDDRLPDIDHCPALSDGRTYHHDHAIKVLAYSPTTIGQTTAFYWGKENNNDPMSGWSLLGVTHWQPLPSPPSQKENNLKTK